MRITKSAGVTLIELMVSVAILSIGVLAAVGSFHLISESLQVSKTRSLSNNLAQEQIEKLKNLSYYMLLVTTAPYSDTRFSPPIEYDTGNYAAQTIMEGGIRYTRGTRVDFAFQNGNNISTAPWSSDDTSLKKITIYVMWLDGDVWRYTEMHNLVANPAANPLNAAFQGYVRNAATNAVLPGAQIEVIGNPSWFGFANSAGFYRFAVAEGSYTLQCTSSGYFTGITTGSYLSIDSGQTKTWDFRLTKISTATATGTVWTNDHLVISQVMGGTETFSGSTIFNEYVEVFNPTTWTWTMAMGMNVNVINLSYDHQGSGGEQSITMVYSSSTVNPGSYFLFASASPIIMNGGSRNADAVYNALNANYPNIIKTDEDVGNTNAGAVKLKWATSGVEIDRMGWTTTAHTPPFYETTPYAQLVGLSNGEQYVRRTSTASTVTSGQGRAYDSNDNSIDFVTQAAPLKNTSDSETVIAGTPAPGAVVNFSDGLSNSAVATLVGGTVANPPYAEFSVTNIATGTWTMGVSTRTYYREYTVPLTGTTGVPHATTSPAWPLSGINSVLLADTTSFGFVAGTVRNAFGTGIAGIIVSGGGRSVNSSSSGRYYLATSTGDVQISANPGNANKAYTSESRNLFLDTGVLVDNQDFNLSLAGILRGYFQTGSNTPLPSRAAVALDGGNQVAQGVSDNSGYFYLANLATGTYVVQPALDPAEQATPTSVTINLTSTGTATTISTFTVTSGLSEITGQVLLSSTPITTGVLVLATTATLAGGAATPPPTAVGGRGVLCNPCSYSTSSDSTGAYSISLRSASTAYKVYGWYTTFSGTTPSFTRKGPYSVNVSTGGMILNQNLTWP